MTIPLQLLKKKILISNLPAIKKVLRKIILATSLLWFIDFNTYAQVDKKKLDSLSRSIDSFAHAYKMQQDSVIRHQDSVYKYEVNKAIQQNKSNSDAVLSEQKRRAARERQQALLRIVISIALFIIGMVVWLRKRKTRF